jgi:hypothetical protein
MVVVDEDKERREMSCRLEDEHSASCARHRGADGTAGAPSVNSAAVTRLACSRDCNVQRRRNVKGCVSWLLGLVGMIYAERPLLIKVVWPKFYSPPVCTVTRAILMHADRIAYK